MTNTQSSNNTINIATTSQLSKNLTIKENFGQELIFTTSDKVKLCLQKHQEGFGSRKAYHTPLGLFLSLLGTLLVSDFKNWGMSSDGWRSFFVFCCLASLIWLIKTILLAWNNKNIGTIEKIVDDIKVDSIQEKNS